MELDVLFGLLLLLLLLSLIYLFLFFLTVVELLKLLNDSIMILDRENLSHSCTQCWSVN